MVTTLLFAGKVLSSNLEIYIYFSLGQNFENQKCRCQMRIELRTSPTKDEWLMKAPPSSFSFPLPHLLFLILSSSSSPHCHTCWWKDWDSTGHCRWKPLLPEWLSICSKHQSGTNMHICLYIWNVLSLLYAMVLKFFWWGMMRASPLFTAISWRKKNFFHFFFHSPPYFTPL